MKFFESLYQPSVSVGKTKPAGSFGLVCWKSNLGGLICLCCSWLFEVGIELRLSCWIPESFRKVLEFFESLYQPSVSVGKTKPSGSFGSVCWNGSLGCLICLCWFLVIRSQN